jgi:hypothetical protein
MRAEPVGLIDLCIEVLWISSGSNVLLSQLIKLSRLGREPVAVSGIMERREIAGVAEAWRRRVSHDSPLTVGRFRL